MIRPLVCLAVCVAVLAGCEMPAREGVELPDSEWTPDKVARLVHPPRSRVAAESEEPDQVPLPRRRPDQVAVATPPLQSDAEELSAEQAPAEEPTDLQIDQLVGLDFDATQALLGEPALDQVQAPARVWAYSGSGCVLNIFFYPNVDGSTYRALTYEVKGGDDSVEFRERCFAELLSERAKEGP